MNKLVKALSPVILVLAIMFVVPISASAVTGSEIVNYARQFIGCAYVRNTHGPSTFDCSGFVYYVFNHFGITMSLSSNDYYSNPGKFGTVVGTGSTANAVAGDLISWSGHVAIYTGNGRCVEALNAKYGVTEAVAVNKHTNGMNYKVIRVNGVTNGSADKEAPAITNAKAADVTFTSFSVSCTLKDNTGVSKVVIDVTPFFRSTSVPTVISRLIGSWFCKSNTTSGAPCSTATVIPVSWVASVISDINLLILSSSVIFLFLSAFQLRQPFFLFEIFADFFVVCLLCYDCVTYESE